MLKTRSWQIGLGIIFMVLGFLFTVQLRTQWKILALLPTRQINKLAKTYSDQQKELQKYKQEYDYLREQVKNYNQEREILHLRMANGLVPLKGKGIVITLDEPDKNISDFEDPSFYYIDFFQLKLLINELWVKGAEAIAINNHRVKSTSGFNCAGTIILVDTKKIVPPYKIAVIGDPDNLTSVLTAPGGIIEEEIINRNLNFHIKVADEIEIPAYKKILPFEYARPVKE